MFEREQLLQGGHTKIVDRCDQFMSECERLEAHSRGAHFTNDLDLKPCPFCGGMKWIFEKFKMDGHTRYAVFCPGCGSMTSHGHLSTIHAAVLTWQTRVNEIKITIG